jgi:hypothetical protein
MCVCVIIVVTYAQHIQIQHIIRTYAHIFCFCTSLCRPEGGNRNRIADLFGDTMINMCFCVSKVVNRGLLGYCRG